MGVIGMTVALNSHIYNVSDLLETVYERILNMNHDPDAPWKYGVLHIDKLSA